MCAVEVIYRRYWVACINMHDFLSWSLTTGEVLGLPRVEIPPEVDVRMSEKVLGAGLRSF